MKIAILEDDPSQAKFIAGILEEAGHVCSTFPTGKALISRLRQDTFDLVLLDWNLPDMSGIEVLNWIHRVQETPPAALIVTSRSAQADIVAGLDAGADDFIVKPADELILLARVNAVLRRAHPAESTNRIETIGAFIFDPLKESVTVRGEAAPLTSKEFQLALFLFRNLNRALSRSYLLETIWGHEPDLPTRTLDAHVSRIRLKLGLRPENGFRLAPIYSYGYRLETLSDAAPESE